MESTNVTADKGAEGRESAVRTAVRPAIRPAAESPLPDYVVRYEDGLYAGRHLLLDLWGGTGLDDSSLIETALRDAARAAGATVLHVHLHRFSDNGGISGVAVLAESHISIHTWPEWDYAAIDVFMCGRCDPDRSVETIRAAFAPDRMDVGSHPRGRLD